MLGDNFMLVDNAGLLIVCYWVRVLVCWKWEDRKMEAWNMQDQLLEWKMQTK